MAQPGVVKRFFILTLKNSLSKLRNWPVLFLEFLTPIILILLLALLVHLIPNVHHPTSQTAAKALPSAGLIPFLQTLFCDITDTRTNGPDGAPHFEGSKTDQLYSAYEKIFSVLNIQNDENIQSFSKFLLLFERLNTDFSKSQNSTNHTSSIPHYNTNGNISDLMEEITYLCTNDPQILKYLEIINTTSCNQSNSISDIVESLNSKQRLLLNSLTTLYNSRSPAAYPNSCKHLEFNDISKIKLYLQDISQSSNILAEFFKKPEQVLCGSNVTSDQVRFNNYYKWLFVKRAFYGENNLEKSSSKKICNHTVHSNETMHCGKTSKKPQSLELKDSGFRIIFSPNTTLTWSIIREMNTSLAFIDETRDIIHAIQAKNQLLISMLNKFSEADTKQTLVHNLRNLASIKRNLTQQNLSGPNQISSENLELTANLLDRDNTNGSLWYYTSSVHNLTSFLLSQPIFKVKWDFFMGFENEIDLRNVATSTHLRHQFGIKELYAGIVFQNVTTNSTHLPPITTYKLLVNFSSIMGAVALRDLIWRPDPENYPYYTNDLQIGEIFLQDLIERALIRIKTNSTVFSPGAYVQPFPYPCYDSNIILMAGQLVIPLVITAGQVWTIILLCRVIINEKEKRLTDMMSIFGVGMLEYWASWVFIYYIQLIPTAIISAVILKLGGILPKTNPLIVVCVLLTYNLSLSTLAILLSIPFKRSIVGASTVGIVYFLIYFLVPLIQMNEFVFPLWALITSQSMVPISIAMFFSHAVEFELIGVGLQWHNLANPPFDIAVSNPALSWGCMFMDGILYIILAIYLYQVLVGIYGIRKPFYFVFLPSYWIGVKRWRRLKQSLHFHQRKYENILNIQEEDIPSDEIRGLISDNQFEPLAEEDEPNHLKCGVRIENVSKKYKMGLFGMHNHVNALNGLSINLYEGQITTLLGHNGAGKTTLMMILSGLYLHTSGKITIYGHSLEKERKILRINTIGLCPQHNILFSENTVREHFLFYGYLRGLTYKDIVNSSNVLLKTMRLSDSINKKVNCLSGGMARKLSVCLAFLGSPRLVILDEPTAGVDPTSRREIWNFLISERENRCILLSTHHMDEAEVVSDRLAMIDHGHLLCVGTLQYLKSAFNLSYSLILAKKQEYNGLCDSELGQLVQNNVENISKPRVSKLEIKFYIPITTINSQQSSFIKLLEEIEVNKDRLSISSYGLSAPNIEQLFLMLTEFTFKDDRKERETDEKPTSAKIKNLFVKENKYTYLYLKILVIQILALFIKRFHHLRRDISRIALQFGLFLLIVVLTMTLNIIISIQPRISDNPHLFPGLHLQLNSPQYVFIGSSNSQSDAHEYLNTMVCPGGLGVPPFMDRLDHSHPHCRQITNMNELFVQQKNLVCSFQKNQSCWSDVERSNFTETNITCKCSSDEMFCPAQPRPPEMLAVGDGCTIQDLYDGYNITEYLLSSFQDFILKRYLGSSFGYERQDIPLKNSTKSERVKENGTNVFSFDANSLAVRNFSKAWFTFKAYRAMPISLNVMNNAILRRELIDKLGYIDNFTDFGIISNFEVWGKAPNQLIISEIVTGRPCIIPLFMLLAFSFLAVHSLKFAMNEYASGVRNLQIVSGLNQTLYFITNFLTESILYIFALLLCLAILYIFQFSPFLSSTQQPYFILAILGFGFFHINLMQFFARFEVNPSVAYAISGSFIFLTGMISLVMVFILKVSNYVSMEKKIENIFVYFPQCSFVLILYNLIIENAYSSALNTFGSSLYIPGTDFSEQHNFVVKGLILMYCEGFVIFGINFVITILSDLNFPISIVKRKFPPVFSDDSDVEEERTNVLSNTKNFEQTLSIERMYKKYFSLKNIGFFRCQNGPREHFAVEDVSFGVQNECFGLLGLNGAGKTTIFNSIVGFQRLTSGNIKFRGENMHKIRKKFFKQLGYAPQMDALFDLMTANEHLLYYGRLKGLSGINLQTIAKQLIDRVQLDEYQNMLSFKFSGGNKRKLLTAISLISNPQLLLLDEPTSGVDPYAKQLLWSILQEGTANGISTLITTHSMGECEVLCSRISILHKGHLECIGSPQHLKEKYGRGYVLKFYFAIPHHQENFISKLNNYVPQAKIQERHGTFITCNVEDLEVSEMVKFCLEMKSGGDIHDFSIGQYSLNEVFSNIIKKLDREDDHLNAADDMSDIQLQVFNVDN